MVKYAHRVKFNKTQREYLEKKSLKCINPNKKQICQMSLEINLPFKTITKYFQNKRYYLKKKSVSNKKFYHVLKSSLSKKYRSTLKKENQPKTKFVRWGWEDESIDEFGDPFKERIDDIMNPYNEHCKMTYPNDDFPIIY